MKVDKVREATRPIPEKVERESNQDTRTMWEGAGSFDELADRVTHLGENDTIDAGTQRRMLALIEEVKDWPEHPPTNDRKQKFNELLDKGSMQHLADALIVLYQSALDQRSVKTDKVFEKLPSVVVQRSSGGIENDWKYLYTKHNGHVVVKKRIEGVTYRKEIPIKDFEELNPNFARDSETNGATVEPPQPPAAAEGGKDPLTEFAQAIAYVQNYNDLIGMVSAEIAKLTGDERTTLDNVCKEIQAHVVRQRESAGSTRAVNIAWIADIKNEPLRQALTQVIDRLSAREEVNIPTEVRLRAAHSLREIIDAVQFSASMPRTEQQQILEQLRAVGLKQVLRKIETLPVTIKPKEGINSDPAEYGQVEKDIVATITNLEVRSSVERIIKERIANRNRILQADKERGPRPQGSEKQANKGEHPLILKRMREETDEAKKIEVKDHRIDPERTKQFQEARAAYRQYRLELNVAREQYLMETEKYESMRHSKIRTRISSWFGGVGNEELRARKVQMKAAEKRYDDMLSTLHSKRQEQITAYKDRFAARHNADRKSIDSRLDAMEKRIIGAHAAVLDRAIDNDVHMIERLRLSHDEKGESRYKFVRMSRAAWDIYRGVRPIQVKGKEWRVNGYARFALGVGLVAGGAGLGAAFGLLSGGWSAAGAAAFFGGRRALTGAAGLGAASVVGTSGYRYSEKREGEKLDALHQAARGQSWEQASIAGERKARLRVRRQTRGIQHLTKGGAVATAIVAGSGASQAFADVIPFTPGVSTVPDVDNNIKPVGQVRLGESSPKASVSAAPEAPQAPTAPIAATAKVAEPGSTIGTEATDTGAPMPSEHAPASFIPEKIPPDQVSTLRKAFEIGVKDLTPEQVIDLQRFLEQGDPVQMERFVAGMCLVPSSDQTALAEFIESYSQQHSGGAVPHPVPASGRAPTVPTSAPASILGTNKQELGDIFERGVEKLTKQGIIEMPVASISENAVNSADPDALIKRYNTLSRALGGNGVPDSSKVIDHRPTSAAQQDALSLRPRPASEALQQQLERSHHVTPEDVSGVNRTPLYVPESAPKPYHVEGTYGQGSSVERELQKFLESNDDIKKKFGPMTPAERGAVATRIRMALEHDAANERAFSVRGHNWNNVRAGAGYNVDISHKVIEDAINAGRSSHAVVPPETHTGAPKPAAMVQPEHHANAPQSVVAAVRPGSASTHLGVSRVVEQQLGQNHPERVSTDGPESLVRQRPGGLSHTARLGQFEQLTYSASDLDRGYQASDAAFDREVTLLSREIPQARTPDWTGEGSRISLMKVLGNPSRFEVSQAWFKANSAALRSHWGTIEKVPLSQIYDPQTGRIEYDFGKHHIVLTGPANNFAMSLMAQIEHSPQGQAILNGPNRPATIGDLVQRLAGGEAPRAGVMPPESVTTIAPEPTGFKNSLELVQVAQRILDANPGWKSAATVADLTRSNDSFSDYLISREQEINTSLASYNKPPTFSLSPESNPTFGSWTPQQLIQYVEGNRASASRAGTVSVGGLR